VAPAPLTKRLLPGRELLAFCPRDKVTNTHDILLT
jgi:hypothetical protein